jgi:hypothetical protein
VFAPDPLQLVQKPFEDVSFPFGRFRRFLRDLESEVRLIGALLARGSNSSSIGGHTSHLLGQVVHAYIELSKSRDESI